MSSIAGLVKRTVHFTLEQPFRFFPGQGVFRDGSQTFRGLFDDEFAHVRAGFGGLDVHVF